MSGVAWVDCGHGDVEVIRFRMTPIFGLPGPVTVEESRRCRVCGVWLASGSVDEADGWTQLDLFEEVVE